jgi:hypothetical protein
VSPMTGSLVEVVIPALVPEVAIEILLRMVAA